MNVEAMKLSVLSSVSKVTGAASDVAGENPHIGVCQGPWARTRISTLAAGPGRSTICIEPMRRQEPSESAQSGLATVGCCCVWVACRPGKIPRPNSTVSQEHGKISIVCADETIDCQHLYSEPDGPTVH